MQLAKRVVSFFVAALALGGILGVVIMGNLACADGNRTHQQGSTPKAAGIPPIDKVQPKDIQTATFATG